MLSGDIPLWLKFLLLYRAMLYDAARYPNPEVFNPERFLDSQGLLIEDDPTEIIFGFGRRSCPGESHHTFPAECVAHAKVLYH